MLKKYVVALDQGTTSSRAVLFDKHGSIVGIKSKPLNQIYPKPGWVEHDPMEIFNGQLEVLREALTTFEVKPEEIAGIGIANQRETVIVWDKDTGEPIYNAIVWQCRRTADMCQYLKADGLSEVVREKTGLLIDAYFSGTKIKWILDNVPGAREKASNGKLLAGTVDCWLIWNLTGGKVHVTDYSNASRTMLFNIKTLNWDDELLNKLDIPKNILPQVVKSSEVIGETIEEILGVKVPIGGVAGDQQAALFGQACFEEGSAKNTYGTGCFILMNIGKKMSKPADKLLTTIAWDIGEGVEYALEGSIFNAGATVQWLVDELKLVQSPKEADIEAYSVPDTGGVYVVPAFTGLGAPYWDMFARGTIVGITRGTNKAHIVRATLESIAYQSKDVLEAMSAEAGISLKELNVDGGVSRSSFVMQFQADILRIPVNKPRVIETTALGAAYLAGLATGFWNSREEIRKNRELDRAFLPSADKELTDAMYKDWKRAVERSMNWIK